MTEELEEQGADSLDPRGGLGSGGWDATLGVGILHPAVSVLSPGQLQQQRQEEQRGLWWSRGTEWPL